MTCLLSSIEMGRFTRSCSKREVADVSPRYEGVIFSNMSATTQVQETVDAKDMFPLAGPAFFSRLYQLYPRPSYNSTFYQRQTWFGDFIINCPTYYMGFNAVER